ncbi:hypothetical protein Pelo_638 [Pelomyxa schiedti]|nr:hypothetical protein Pelo_638 [Pelomyxa schiedti]
MVWDSDSDSTVALVKRGLIVVYCTKWDECQHVAKALVWRGIAEVTSVSIAVNKDEFLRHTAAINGKAVVCTTPGGNIDFLVNAGFKASVVVHWDQAVDRQEKASVVVHWDQAVDRQEKVARDQACKTDGVIITMNPTEHVFGQTSAITTGTASAVPASASAPAPAPAPSSSSASASVQMANPRLSDLDRELDAQYDFIVTRWNAKKEAVRVLSA